jgi:phosphotransferase system HPr-like phosphotransfer protein
VANIKINTIKIMKIISLNVKKEKRIKISEEETALQK